MAFSTDSKDRDMNAAAQTDLRDFAAAEWPRLNHKGRLRELCRLLPWTDRRVRSVYNAESGVSLRADEQAAIEALRIEEATRDDIRTLQSRIARLEAALFAQDENFHGPQMAGYRQATDRRR